MSALAGLILGSAIIQAAAAVSIAHEVVEPLCRVPVEWGGKVMPFERFAQEALTTITGSRAPVHKDPMVDVLAIMAKPELWADMPLMPINGVDVRRQLGLRASGLRVSASELEASKLHDLLPSMLDKLQRREALSPAEEEIFTLYLRWTFLQNLMSQEILLVPARDGWDSPWLPVLRPDGYHVAVQMRIKLFWSEFLQGIREGDEIRARLAAERLAKLLHQLEKDKQHSQPSSRYVLAAGQGPLREAFLWMASISALLAFSSGRKRSRIPRPQRPRSIVGASAGGVRH